MVNTVCTLDFTSESRQEVLLPAIQIGRGEKRGEQRERERNVCSGALVLGATAVQSTTTTTTTTCWRNRMDIRLGHGVPRPCGSACGLVPGGPASRDADRMASTSTIIASAAPQLAFLCDLGRAVQHFAAHGWP